MRILLGLLYFLFLHYQSVLVAQPGEPFVLSFDPNPQSPFKPDKAYRMWSIGNDIYFINGYVETDEYKRKNQLFKLNADTKQIVDSVNLGALDGDMSTTGYCVTSDGHILLTGEWQQDGTGIMHLFLTKLTPDLETVWMHFYPDLLPDTYLYAEGLAETDEGDYLIYIAESTTPPPHTWGELRVIRTDSTGAIELNKSLVDTFTQTYGFGDLIKTYDGNFIISSFVIDYYSVPILGTFRYIALLHKIDENANQIWSKALNYTKFDLQMPWCAPRMGGGAVMWRKDTFPAAAPPELLPGFSLLYGFNNDGETEWQREWNTMGYKFMNRIIEAANGDLIALGYFDLVNGSGKGLLTRLSSETGDVIWERRYSDSLVRPWAQYIDLLDVCELADGRIAACGTVLDTNAMGYLNPNVVVLVFDENGCLEPGCSGQDQYVTGLSNPIIAAPALPLLEISPNPASGPIRIHFPGHESGNPDAYQIRCFASDGRWNTYIPWEPHATVDLGALGAPSGTYFILLYKNGQPVATGRCIFTKP